MTKVKNPVGAPKQMDAGRNRNLYIDDEDYLAIKNEGGGVASKGLRRIIQKFRKKQKGQ